MTDTEKTDLIAEVLVDWNMGELKDIIAIRVIDRIINPQGLTDEEITIGKQLALEYGDVIFRKAL